MAEGPALALQAALIVALKSDYEVAALVDVRVYDEPPPAVVFPYIRIGEIIAQPFHTDGKEAFEITFGIEGHSRPKSTPGEAGRVAAAMMANAIQGALHDQTLTITGYENAWTFCETFTATRDVDGESYTARVAFTAMLDVA
jgi:hypothetical protein